MSFRVRSETRSTTGPLDPTVFVLEDVRHEGVRSQAEVWPALGFNCYRWQVDRQGQPLELLYADPALFGDARPTRSGNPILFPFPNRIRDGRFAWQGKEYSLPLNDPAKKNGIHGWACRHPWRVLDQGGDDSSAWVTAAFRCSVDAPECLPFWPADHEVTITYRLGMGTLRVEAEVHNPDKEALPFGLGYHPYFRLPFAGSVNPEECRVEVPAAQFWELEGNLPTGNRIPVGPERNLNKFRPLSELHLDDVLTALPGRAPRADGLIERGCLEGGGGAALRVFCSPEFRDVVVFTPPHRHAFCIEPYTCVTDAINLEGKVTQAGLIVLPPGGRWQSVVEYWV
jgi:aldose 1-epimerase